MMIPKTLHARDDIETLLVSKKKEGRGLAGIENSIDISIHEDYIKRAKKD